MFGILNFVIWYLIILCLEFREAIGLAAAYQQHDLDRITVFEGPL
jgi:hypothetical protein